MSKTFLFQAIQFSISTYIVNTVSMSKTVSFQAIQFSQTVLIQTIQFSISIQLGPYQVLLFWARVDLGAMVMKGCSTFPKAPASL